VMSFSTSLTGEKTRSIFLIFFTLASLLPFLLILFVIFQYVLPVLTLDQIRSLREIFTYGLMVMLLIPLLSFFLMSRWIGSLEAFTEDVKSKSAQVIEEEKDIKEENEILTLIRYFDAIFQTATNQLAEREHLKEMLFNLIAVAHELTAELDFDKLFPLIIGKVTDVMSAQRTSLYIIDWEGHEIWTKVAEHIDPISLPLGKGISGRVAESGEVLNVVDAWELPYFDRTFDQEHRFRTKSVLCMPIKNHVGDRIGVIQVINKTDKERFDSEDEIFLKALASQIGIALENSLLIEELLLSFQSSIKTLSAMVDARHPLTGGHSKRVTDYSLLIAREMGMSKDEIETLEYAAILHDIGKIGIRDEVLLKNGPFTPEERAEMNTHPLKTKAILDEFHFPKGLREVPDVALHHHEKVNGEGYPDGLTGEQLPLGSKIMTVADVFDALTSRRDYPKYASGETLNGEPMPLSMAVSILKKEAGSHFDPDVVAAFLRCLPQALMRYRGDHFPVEYVDNTIRSLAPDLLP
jgi:HD-GYP domain-containing protein (c-di-GMP phosphodiesterase class II)